MWGEEQAIEDGRLEPPDVLNLESVNMDFSCPSEVKILLVKNV